jgi:hypothetical protein
MRPHVKQRPSRPILPGRSEAPQELLCRRVTNHGNEVPWGDGEVAALGGEVRNPGGDVAKLGGQVQNLGEG